jgi:Ala-tRNA(Pro) deacylase
MDSILKDYLEKNKIFYDEYKHDYVFTVNDSRELKKSIPGMHCKCLFLTDGTKFYLLGMPANKRLDTKKLREILKVKKINFASPEKMYELIKIKPGSVSIFGIVNEIHNEVMLLLDEDVWEAEKVGFHPNINNSTLVIDHNSLKKFYESIKNDKHIVKI